MRRNVDHSHDGDADAFVGNVVLLIVLFFIYGVIRA
jgi:hypothetical protein